MNYYLLVILICLQYFILINARLTCIDSGECVKCVAIEMNEEYCKETGKKLKITCQNNRAKIEDYRSCTSTAEDNQLSVLFFQVIMAIVGGLAYWGVQARKQQNMTKFEHRKNRRVNSTRTLQDLITV